MDAPFQATHQTKRMLYEMMLCAEHRGAYVGYVRGEFSRTLTGFFQEVSRVHSGSRTPSPGCLLYTSPSPRDS